MGRPLREEPEGGWHHVFSRGIRRTSIFRDDIDRLKFLELASAALDQRDAKLFAYCLVGNHYHLGLHDRSGEVSGLMHDLGSKYARHFNDRHGLDGPLFKSRFGSRLLQDDRDLLGVSRYIHRNALDVDPLSPLDGYRWSSFRWYLGTRSRPDCFVSEPVLTLAGGRERYRSLVEHEGGAASPMRRNRSGKPVDLVDIERQVAKAYELEHVPHAPAERGLPSDARSCAAALCLELLRLNTADVVRLYGYRDASDCTRAVERYWRQASKDPDLAGRHEQIWVNLVILGSTRSA